MTAAKKQILKIDDKVRVQLNEILADAAALRNEAVKQDTAGVPEMTPVIERCTNCIERIEQFKSVNFPNKK